LRIIRNSVVIICLLLVLAGVFLHHYVRSLGPKAKARVIQALEDRFDADVDLSSLQLSLLPNPHVVGEKLVIRHKGWNDTHPLISIRRFSASTDILTVINRKNHVDAVRLEGLEIHIPPKGRSSLSKSFAGTDSGSPTPGTDQTRLKFLIETIYADGTLLEIEPKVEGKDPLQFEIQKLQLRSVGSGQAMFFTAKLTNPKPPGLINSVGKFGPWQRDEPRSTAVSGEYTFQGADLSVFKGISGILSSTGKYHGVLEQIDVDGTTDTPQFALKPGGDPVHLQTTFHSTVDGTNGDTILKLVDARFLGSEFLCQGGVVRLPGQSGKTVQLDASTTSARMEDILHLIIGKDRPLLQGSVNFQTKIRIPPGKQDVLDKLDLDGKFALSSARFTSAEIERRLRTLTNRARGISKEEEEHQIPHPVASNMRGVFRLDNSVAAFRSLSFSVPGATIILSGKYNLRSEQIDFKGKFRMQSTLSDTQSGIKHWLLKPLDPFFEKNGAGFEVPLEVGGTRTHPEVEAIIFHKHVDIH
jgi:hypothetical protein